MNNQGSKKQRKKNSRANQSNATQASAEENLDENRIEEKSRAKSLSLSSLEVQKVKENVQVFREVTKLQKDNKEKEQEIAAVAEIGKNLLEKNQIAEQALQELQNQENEKDKTINELQEKLQKELAARNSQIASLMQSLHESETSSEKMKEEHGKVERNWKKREKQLADENSDLTSSNYKLSDELTALKSQLKTSVDRELESSRNLTKLKGEYEEISKKNDDSSDVVQKKLEDLKSKIREKSEKIGKMEKQILQLQEQIQGQANLKDELDSLILRNEDLQKENTELFSTLEDARNNIDSLKSIIQQDYTLLNSSLNTSLQDEFLQVSPVEVPPLAPENSQPTISRSKLSNSSSQTEMKRNSSRLSLAEIRSSFSTEVSQEIDSNFLVQCINYDAMQVKLSATSLVKGVTSASQKIFDTLCRVPLVGRVVKGAGNACSWATNKLVQYSIVKNTVHCWVILMLIGILATMYVRTSVKTLLFRKPEPALTYPRKNSDKRLSTTL